MLKKIIALFVIFAMLVPFSTVVAADEPSAPPTVKEILSEYHRKSLESDASRQDGTASAYSRSASGSGKTLEQETVDQLTEAGYEAYNVTSENYNALEESLQTDFSEMGLDPEGSYIIVIEGEPSQQNSNGARVSGDLLLPPHEWDEDDYGGNSDSEFAYTYEGKTYRLRYITVTAADDSDYGVLSKYTIADSEEDITFVDTMNKTLENLLNTIVSATIDEASSVLGTFASIFGLELFDFGRTDETAFSDLTFYGGTNWTRTFTEVYVESESCWKSYLYVEYATTYSFFTGAYYDATLNRYTQVESDEYSEIIYSPNYSNYTFRIEKAIEKYLQGEPGSFYYDKTGRIEYFIDGEVVITHYDSVG